jgi:4-hydroxy-tetrahydrodipicolinate synthase
VADKIKGVIVPLLTPFDEKGRLDCEAAARLAEYLIQRGVHGLFPGGTTGEGPLLATRERRRLAQAVVQAAAGRVPVLVHTGATTTAEAVDLTRHAQGIGARGAVLVPPFYYHHSEEALFHHFAEVAKRADGFPVYLYDNPSVTGNPLTVRLVARLVESYPNIAGMKDSSGALDRLFAYSQLRGGDFNTASGPDELILAGLSMGFDACVSGDANVVPELVVALYRAATQGHLPQARGLHAKLESVRLLLGNGDLALFKAMLAKRGVPVGTVRRPFLSPSEPKVEECWRVLQQIDPLFSPLVG